MSKLSFERLEDRTVPAVIFNGNVQFDALIVIPSTGDVVHVSGPLHIVVDETVDSAGGIHFKEHFQPQGVSGVDLTTGAQYQATGVTQEQEIITANGAANLTFVNNFRLIGQGPNNNYTVHENTHITINANGDVTALIDNIKVDQGSGG
jgi:hypothetical protein